MLASGCGAITRVFLLIYLLCLILSLVPSVVCQPERNFNRGQPELLQAMDNMIRRKILVKKSIPSSGDSKISLLNDKATHLLVEAENMLKMVKDMKEKEWLEQYVYKLKMLASIIEHTVNANQTRENKTEENKITIPLSMSRENSSDLMSNAVPGSRRNQMMSNQIKLPFTLPKMKQVKSDAEYATIDHVTKPEDKTEKDALVEELENLHKISSLEPESITAPETSSPVTQPPLIVEKDENKERIEYEKEKLEEKIAKDVAELKKMGDTEEKILKTIRFVGFKSIDSEADGVKKSVSDNVSGKRVLDENNPYWNLPTNHIPVPPRQIYMNNTFLGMHINLPPFNPRVLRRQFQYGLQKNTVPHYPGGIRGVIQKLKAEEDYEQRNNVYGTPSYYQTERPDMQLRSGEMYPYVHSETRYYPANPIHNRYANRDFKPLYMPYPLNQNVKQSSSIVNDTKSTTYSMSKLSTEFTEEMKRQLRDGKVIILSDSVVSSNFTEDGAKDEVYKTGESKTKKK